MQTKVRLKSAWRWTGWFSLVLAALAQPSERAAATARVYHVLSQAVSQANARVAQREEAGHSAGSTGSDVLARVDAVVRQAQVENRQ